MKRNERARPGTAGRRRVLLISFVLLALVVLVRAFQVEVLAGGIWRELALEQHGDTLRLPAPRGTIYDRNGVPLASTQDVYSVALAPREVRDSAHVRRLLQEQCGYAAAEAERLLVSERKWIVLPGQYSAAVREALDGVPGLHFETVLKRFYPHGALALEVLGAVGVDGLAQSGLELEFDSVLRGRAGRSIVRRDSRGFALPGAMLRMVEPVPGRDVFLSIDQGLQEIAEGALASAVSDMSATGGELLLLDPATGEILAAASRKAEARSFSWRAATEPYEPGSTLKPFTVAGLLTLGRAQLSDSVFAENGEYLAPGRRRPLRDVHGYGMLSLADALRKSSNIGIAKMAARLAPSEQYVLLRDFGFGAPTGVPYPAESGGRLRRPAHWTALSPASLAIGYELSVTPLQMALAYGAIANGGLLLEPRLVREIRARDGRVEARFAPRAVRRAMPEAVAAQLRAVLEGAVTDGTAQQAALGPFAVAGKTGTARISGGRGGYRVGAYYASFAGFFPATDPQLVFLVKIDEPQGDYYGGLAAAPVIRVALEAALAARSSPLDRRAVALPAPRLPEAAAVRAAAALPQDQQGSQAPSIQRVSLRQQAGRALPAAASVSVPATVGLALRDAVNALHTAGFRVRIYGSGAVIRTEPAAGDHRPGGALVKVVGGRG